MRCPSGLRRIVDAKASLIPAAVIVTVSVAAMAIMRKPVLFALSDIGDGTSQPVAAINMICSTTGPEARCRRTVDRLAERRHSCRACVGRWWGVTAGL